MRFPSQVLFWWIRKIILSLVGLFFLLFGIHLLIAAYQLDNPFWFVMTFFSSNLIILISLALIVGFLWQMKLFYGKGKSAGDGSGGSKEA